MKLAPVRSLLAVAGLTAACEPAPASRHPVHPAAHDATSSASSSSALQFGREPTFASSRSRADYDRGVDGLAALDGLRGSVMTEGLATDLGFKCASLRDVPRNLAREHDPLVWRLVSRLDQTCNLDVPMACAFFEIQRIEKRRAAEPGADLRGECAALKLDIADVGTKYLQNPHIVDLIGKDLEYCGSTDTVKVVRPVP